MEAYLLVDGYNIIFAWDDLAAIAERSLEDARHRLIEILSDYQGSTGQNVIAVFDAHNVKDGAGSIEKHGNIHAVYTKEAETADNYIERVAEKLSRDYNVRVATSDGLVQMIILTKGAVRISAREFLGEVRLQKKLVRERMLRDRPVKRNMLMDNLDEKTNEILEKMRRNTDI